ncbi:SRPBCC family protein [Lysinibacillus endophyticus]|uniref:SRPBCC family protein n=1 Tax=Ureibacillus endophyticus TaxID=1978490 RepID=UPI0031350751
MKNITKMSIFKSASEVFEAFVDPAKIGHFWFSSSSERWEQGKTITLRYEEYDYQGQIRILQVVPNQKIVFDDETNHIVTIELIEQAPSHTIIEITEEGFQDNDPDLLEQLIDNKEGWVYMMTCLKAYLEFGITQLRSALVK